MKFCYVLLSGFLLIGVSYGLLGCDDDSGIFADSKFKYLSCDVSSNEFSVDESLIVYEAIKRLDQYVVFRDGQYRLSNVTASEIQISNELFSKILGIMQRTNSLIDGHDVVEVKRNDLRFSDNKDALLNVRLKGLGEDPVADGENGYDMRWYGVDIYLNSSALQGEGFLNASIAAVLGSAPAGSALAVFLESNPYVISVSLIVTAITAGLNWICSDGIIIHYIFFVGPVVECR